MYYIFYLGSVSVMLPVDLANIRKSKGNNATFVYNVA